MKHLREILLVIGLCSVFASNFFFAFDRELYIDFEQYGILLSIVAYILILTKKGLAKLKWTWTGICLASLVLELFLGGSIIQASYMIYYRHNKDNLNKMNNILISSSPQYMLLSKDSLISSDSSISQDDSLKLIHLFRNTSLSHVKKQNNSGEIFYQTWGRHGLYYLLREEPASKPFNKIESNWYYR